MSISFKEIVTRLLEHLKKLKKTIDEERDFTEDIDKLTQFLKSYTDEIDFDSLEKELNELISTRDGAIKKYREQEAYKEALKTIKHQVEKLKEEITTLTSPPSNYAVFESMNGDGTANVYLHGRKMKVGIHSRLETQDLRKGSEIILNEAMVIIGKADRITKGEVVKITEILDDLRLKVMLRLDEEQIAERSDALKGVTLRVGDRVLYEPSSRLVVERLEKSEERDLILEEVPEVSYDDIGGLGAEIEAVRDAVELPFTHPKLLEKYKLPPTKGILLYGPPGCGKTMIAKALAHAICRSRESSRARSFFLHVNGPELLNKYVGETERKIREIFERAKEKGREGHPVIIFFDEMDALFRLRGSGISSDIESTIVPQFLAELDGIEKLSKVVVVGASNRHDLIDPAILRPGRIDIKIKIGRPTELKAVEILSKYLLPELPFDKELLGRKLHVQRNRLREAAAGDWEKLSPDFREFRRSLIKEEKENSGEYWETWQLTTSQKIARYLIVKIVEAVYIKNTSGGELSWIAGGADKKREIKVDNRKAEITYEDGSKEMLYFGDLISGAILESIVSRMKKIAIKREIKGESKGIRMEDGYEAIRQCFKEEGDIPNTMNADDWAKISGRSGKRIVHVRNIENNALLFMTEGISQPQPKIIETVSGTGHYL